MACHVLVTEMNRPCLRFYSFSTLLWLKYSLLVTFIFGTRNIHSRYICTATRNRRRKSAPENGVDLWRRFPERVSRVGLLVLRRPSSVRCSPPACVGLSWPRHLRYSRYWPLVAGLMSGIHIRRINGMADLRHGH